MEIDLAEIREVLGGDQSPPAPWGAIEKTLVHNIFHQEANRIAQWQLCAVRR